MPAQTAQPVDRIGEPRGGGHHHDLLVKAVPRRSRRQHGVETVVEGSFEVDVVETVAT
jgi:hypothetical protein